MNLVYKHEKPLFQIAAVISAIVWIALTVGTFGILLIYILLVYLFFLFAHSAFISHLKGTGVKITAEQYPDLYEKLVKGCQKVGLDTIPDAYLLRTDFFNALATRFLGRHFVVLFTDVVDALQDQPGAIDFYIGHELGHIHRKHLTWSAFLMPASVLPILGTSLRRAEEYTCDRYGVACCDSEHDIKSAIAAIAAGDSRWKSINLNSYLEQIAETKGFWMSFNELTGDYPWLTKRMATAVALKQGHEISHPRRHFFAWFLSLFIPRFGAGGAVSLLITVMLIGILAAIAIPAYDDYTKRVSNKAAYQDTLNLSNQVSDFVYQNNQWPESLQELGYDANELTGSLSQSALGLYQDGVVAAHVGTNNDGNDMFIVLEPVVTEDAIQWDCYGEYVPTKQLPEACR